MTKARFVGRMSRAVLVCLVLWAISGVLPGAVSGGALGVNDVTNIDFALGTGGSISGFVRDGGGTPIEGATVHALGESSSEYDTTAADGSYSIVNLAPGSYEVDVTAAGNAGEYYNNLYASPAAPNVTVTDLTDTPNIDFALGPGGSISGVIEDGSGTPIEYAMVSATTDDHPGGTGFTDENGTYVISNLPPGSYTVQAYATGYVWEYYDGVYEEPAAPNVAVADLADTPNIDFTLGTGGSISGTVTGSGGTPIAGATVSALGTFFGSDTTAADGTYTVTTLAPGSYWVSVDANGYVMEYYNDAYSIPMAPNVAVTDLTDTPDIDFALGVGGSITGFVRDEASTPVQDATVWAMGNSVDFTTTGADGAYSLPHLAPGSYKVSAEADGRISEYYANVYDPLAATGVTVTDLTATPNINFELGPGGSIAGFVRDGSGSPIEGASVHAWQEHSWGDDQTAADGSYTITGLAPGSYLVQADANGYAMEYYNGVYTSASATLVPVTAPDASAPTTPVVTDDGATTSNAAQLHASWIAADAESVIAEYQYAIGTTSGGADVVGWTSTGTDAQVTKTGLSLTVGSTYYISVKAGNAGGLWSGVGTSDGIAVIAPDTTAPTTPVVADDGATTDTANQLHAAWTAADAESGIAEYQYAIGTASGGTDIVNWTSAGTAATVTRTGLTLTTGATYYFSVKARNGSGVWSEVGASDGIQVVAPSDLTAPTTPVVADDGATTASTSQLHASWAAADAESGIAEYQYAIGTTSGGTDVVVWTTTGTEAQVTRTGLTLTPGATCYFSVKARNGGAVWSQVGASDGIRVVAPEEPPEEPAEEKVGESGGTVQTPDGQVAAEFAEGAVTGDVTVAIEQTDYPSDKDAPAGFKAGGICFVIEVTDADGNPVTRLDEPVVITVKYTHADLDSLGGDPDKLVLAYYDEEAGEWETLDTTVNTEEMILSASTTHLSTWAIMQDTGTAGGGTAIWVWIIVGMAAVLGVGGVALFLRRRSAKPQ